jgi:hypothetical protein
VAPGRSGWGRPWGTRRRANQSEISCRHGVDVGASIRSRADSAICLQSTFSGPLTASHYSPGTAYAAWSNEDGTIEAHTEEDRQFVIRVHGMSLSHQRIQRELIDAHGDEGLRELVAELDVVRDPPSTAPTPPAS